MKYYAILLFFATDFFVCACRSQPHESYIGSFDISKDDHHILFSFDKNGESTVYEMNIDGSGLHTLIPSNKSKSFVNPKYSMDGESILFIEYNNTDVQKSTLCIAKSDGTVIKRLTEDDEIITEAIFSKNKNEILFCKANKYDKNSSIGIKAAHGFDIFRLNYLTKEISRVTNLNAYNISSLSEIDSAQILFNLDGGPDGGMYSVSAGITKELKRFQTANDPRKDESMYSNPKYIEKYNIIVFTAPYELYKMDKESRNAELLVDAKGTSNINSVVFFNTSPFILFTKEGQLSFFKMNLNGQGLVKIPVKM
jgi:hypothetical protein